MDYKNAGVDIEAGYESVELMKKFVKGTMRPEVLGGRCFFAGCDQEYGRAGSFIRNRWMRNQGKTGFPDGQA